jgi:hypothetical protein
MTQLIADQTPMEVLAQLTEPTEICDANGKVIGRYTPSDAEHVEALQRRLATSIDWDEMRRRSRSTERRYSLQETLARLKELEQETERRKAAGEKELTTEEAVAYMRTLREGKTASSP